MKKKILDITMLDGRSIQERMADDRPYSAARVPPGVLLTMEQFDEWLRLGTAEGVQAQERYATRVASAAA